MPNESGIFVNNKVCCFLLLKTYFKQAVSSFNFTGGPPPADCVSRRKKAASAFALVFIFFQKLCCYLTSLFA